MCLIDFGWTDSFSKEFNRIKGPGQEAARVTQVHRGGFVLQGENVEIRARVRGRLAPSLSTVDEVAIGDWVAYRPGGPGLSMIEAILSRKSVLSRKVPGSCSQEQVLAANLDTVLVVMGLDGDFSPRRLERLLAVVHQSGAMPVVVLNKVDLSLDWESRINRVEAMNSGFPVLPVSARTGTGLEVLESYLRPRETLVLLGSSGAGKSTLVNRFMGRQLLRTAPVRPDDSRGRHTTTHRQLFRLPSGALLIDSPGIREVQLWAEEESLDETFQDIRELALNCRFRDCGHLSEPGCAVLDAVQAGELDPNRLESYQRLARELQYLERRQTQALRLAEKQKWRAIHRSMRHHRKWNS
jgi:ribosome biogenesis GTPase